MVSEEDIGDLRRAGTVARSDTHVWARIDGIMRSGGEPATSHTAAYRSNHAIFA